MVISKSIGYLGKQKSREREREREREKGRADRTDMEDGFALIVGKNTKIYSN